MGKRRRDALTGYLVRRLIIYALALALCSAVLDGFLESVLRGLPENLPLPWFVYGFLLLDAAMLGGFVALFARVIRRRVREENERVARERTRMMADLGHDLRSPLTSVKGYARAISDGRLKAPQEILRAAEIIHRRAGDMEGLVSQMLDYAQAQRGGPESEKRVPSLAALVREAVAEHYPLFEERHISLQCELSADAALRADPAGIRRAFENVLLNCLTHCGENTQVKVVTGYSVGKRGPALRLAVMDSGPDIPKHLRERIFASFFKLDESRGAAPGHGLGLSIARELVEEAGGTLSLEDAGPPFTKAFVFVLPCEEAVSRSPG